MTVNTHMVFILLAIYSFLDLHSVSISAGKICVMRGI